MLQSNRIPELLEKPPAEEAWARMVWWPLETDRTAALAQLEPISLDEMAGVALLDRRETKYLFHEDRLPELLEALVGAYRVLEIDGNRLNHYRTLYFDTSDFALFRRHQAGGRNRYKVRSRAYLDTDVSFLEVKHKVNKDRTRKKRLSTADFVDELSARPVLDFLRANLPANEWQLEPKLWNGYRRITLVSRRAPERVTLDLNLQFTARGESIVLPGLVVAEVKRSENAGSPFIEAMRERAIRSGGFSKYCVGVSLLYGEVKHNRLKPTLRRVGQLIRGEGQYVQ